MAVTADQVRELVARLADTVEGAHHGHPDFRVKKKIFATLSEAEDRCALRLSHVEARALAASRPSGVRLVSDREPIAWISIDLSAIAAEELADLLEEAWKLRAP
jgi:hypothetical protein